MLLFCSTHNHRDILNTYYRLICTPLKAQDVDLKHEYV